MRKQTKRWLLALVAGLSCLMAGSPGFSAIAETRLVGLAMHSETGRNIYIGALHYNEQVPTPDNLVTADGPKSMEYRVIARRTSIRSLMGNILLQGELATGNTPDTSTIEFVGEIMAAVHGSLYAGDSLEIQLGKDDSTVASLSGLELARTDNREVSDYFLLGWVGEKGPSAAFRSSILSKEIDGSLMSIYSAHTVSNDRLAVIRSWNQPAEAEAPAVVDDANTVEPAAVAAPTGIVVDTATVVPAGTVLPMSTAVSMGVDVPVSTAFLAYTTPTATSTAPEASPATPTATTTASATNEFSASTVTPPQENDPATTVPESSSTEQTTVEEPLLLASLSPTREMILSEPEEKTAAEAAVEAIDAIEYSQRLATFNTLVMRNVYAQIRYPKTAVRRNIQGTLELDLVVSDNGSLVNISIARSSGHGMLDKAAIKAATAAFKKTPLDDIDQVAFTEYSDDGQQLVIPIPISFILTE